MEPGNSAQTALRHQRGEQPETSAIGELDQTGDLKRLQKGLNLGPLFRIIRRNALLVASLVVTITLANALISLRTPRSYGGGFRLLVEPITSDAKLTDPSVLSRGGENSASSVDYPTLLQVLQSPGMLGKVAKRIQPRYPDVTLDSLNNDLLFRNLIVQRIGTNLLDYTKLIDVTYGGSDPQKVQAVLEALAQEYLNYSLEARKSRISGGVDFIEGQLPELQQRVSDLQQQLQVLQQRYNLTDPSLQGTELAKQSLTIENLKLDTQREIQEQNVLYATLRNQLQLSPNEAIAASVLSQDPRYQELLNELKKIESQIAVKSARFSSESPVLQSLQEQRANLSGLLEQETRRILGQSLPNSAGNPQVLAFQNSIRLELIKQLAEAANKIQVLTARNQALTQTANLTINQLGQIPAIIRQYSDLQRQLEIATKTLNQLTLQRDTLRVEAAQKEVPWQLVSEPKLPLDVKGQPMPMARDIKKKLPIGVAVGLLLGIGSAVLLEKLRNLFLCTEDVQDAIKRPILSVIPYSEQARLTYEGNLIGMGSDMHLATTEPSLFKESFSALFASLRFLESSQSIRSLVVGSASLGDGKTTVALHLAQAAATMGQRVLLVDANFRFPQLHKRLGLPNAQGLAEILEQDLDPMEWIQQSPLAEKLFVLTAGIPTADSPQHLASSRMQHLVAQLQTKFDLVIYDVPHLLGLTDTNFLTAYTDGLVLVVSLRKTRRSVVMQVLTELQSFQLPVLGIVINHLEAKGSSSYGYQLPTYQPAQKLRPLL